jgi:hypothetical protein
MDEPIPGKPTYQAGIGGHLLRGELSYIYSVMTDEFPLVERPALRDAVRDVAVSLVRQPRFDYASPDDPMPFVRDSWNVLQEWIGDWTAEPDDHLARAVETEQSLESESDRDAADVPGSITAE